MAGDDGEGVYATLPRPRLFRSMYLRTNYSNDRSVSVAFHQSMNSLFDRITLRQNVSTATNGKTTVTAGRSRAGADSYGGFEDGSKLKTTTRRSKSGRGGTPFTAKQVTNVGWSKERTTRSETGKRMWVGGCGGGSGRRRRQDPGRQEKEVV